MKQHYLIFLLLISWSLNAQLAITMPGGFEKHNGNHTVPCTMS